MFVDNSITRRSPPTHKTVFFYRADKHSKKM